MIYEPILLAIFSLFLAPFLIMLSVVIFMAAIGKNLGIRRLYIESLFAIFEWGKQRMARHSSSFSDADSDNNSDLDDEDRHTPRQVLILTICILTLVPVLLPVLVVVMRIMLKIFRLTYSYPVSVL